MTQIMFTRAWKMQPYSNRKTVAGRGRSYRDCANTIPARNGNPVQAACVCTQFFWIKRIRDEYPSRSLLQAPRSEEHTSELQSLAYLVCRLLLEKKNKNH